MKYASARFSAGLGAVRIEGSKFGRLAASDVGSLLHDTKWSSGAPCTEAVADLRLAPLIPRPEKIVCVGYNYVAHMKELGMDPPAHPSLFAKFSRALIGAHDDIVLPTCSDQVDWEAELAVVIGQSVRHADPEAAQAAIAGYTIANDVSVRDWQMRTRQALQGKTWERTMPLGPYLVTPDEVDNARDLHIECYVDGVLMQEASTKDMLFSPVELVSYISTFITLVAGDVILTGSPAGVGFLRTPPIFLKPGSVVRTRIEGIGELINRCCRE